MCLSGFVNLVLWVCIDLVLWVCVDQVVLVCVYLVVLQSGCGSKYVFLRLPWCVFIWFC